MADFAGWLFSFPRELGTMPLPLCRHRLRLLLLPAVALEAWSSHLVLLLILGEFPLHATFALNWVTTIAVHFLDLCEKLTSLCSSGCSRPLWFLKLNIPWLRRNDGSQQMVPRKRATTVYPSRSNSDWSVCAAPGMQKKGNMFKGNRSGCAEEEKPVLKRHCWHDGGGVERTKMAKHMTVSLNTWKAIPGKVDLKWTTSRGTHKVTR